MSQPQHVMIHPKQKGHTPGSNVKKGAYPHPKHPQDAAKHLDFPVQVVGSTAHVTVLCDPALGQQGLDVAQAVLASAEADWQKAQDYFGPSVTLPSCNVIVAGLPDANNKPITDGTGGAYHYSCADATLYCDVSFGSPQRTSALFIAELSEVGQATQNGGWDCGATNGEGLSRIHAETAYPGALDDYESASAFLDGQRPNWIDQSKPTDQDFESNGEACLFITWMMSLGYSVSDITQTPASTLAGVYKGLTGKDTAWPDFSAACQANWPQGQASGVNVDNPWGAPAPPPTPQPGPTPPPAPTEGSILHLSGIDAAGEYILVPVPTSAVARLKAGVIPWGTILAILQAILTALAGSLPTTTKK